MSFPCAALVLLVAGSVAEAPRGPEAGNSEEAAREVRHVSAWAEVAPVPVPATLPLAGPEGVDAAGYPRRYVDRPALRSLLLNRRFAELTLAIETFQTKFEGDPRFELWMNDAVSTLGISHPRERKLLDDWAKETPSSFAPYLARASYWVKQGFVYRAAKLARDTSGLEFSSMAEAFAEARRDADRAIARRPRLVEARRLLFKIEIAGGSRARAADAMEDAVRLCPTCYEVRAEWIGWALLPRWGGSLGEMATFATARADPGNPRHRLLRGFVDFERSEEALRQGNRAEAKSAIDKACALGDDWRFFRQRAALKRQLGDQAGRLADLERANALRPGIPWVVFGRAWALADAQRWEEAARDLLYVLRSEPTSELAIWLLPTVVRAVDTLAWKQHQSGQAVSAVRLYDLATALAPRDAEMARRSTEARAALATPGPASGGDPSAGIGDPRPELVGEVVDASGSVVRGARIRVFPRGIGAPELEFLRDSKIETDASGTFRTRVAPGTWLVVASLPGEPLRAGMTAIRVTTIGATVKIAAGGRGKLSGTVLDRTRRPVAGIVVSAIPKMEREAAQVRTFASGTTRTDGRFTVEGVDEGEYELFGSGNGRRGPIDHGGRGVPAVAGQQDLVLLMDSERFVRGRVAVATVTGIHGPPTTFTVASQAFGERRFSTADGSFSIPVLNRWANLEVAFSTPEHPPVLRTLDVLDGVNDVGTIVVGPGRTIRGRVLDPRGFVAANANVLLGQGTAVRTPVALSRQDGTFEAAIPAGPVKLLVRHERWLPAERLVGADEAMIDVSLTEGARLRFRIVETDGAPIARAAIIVSRPYAVDRTCTSDASGRCEIAGLAPGQYRVQPTAPALDPDRPVPAPITVPLRADDSVRGIDLVLPRRPSRVMVQVLDASGAPTKRGARAFSGQHPLSELLDGSEPKVAHFDTRESRFDNLAPGRYTFVALGPRGLRECAMAVLDVATAADETLTLRFNDGSCR